MEALLLSAKDYFSPYAFHCNLIYFSLSLQLFLKYFQNNMIGNLLCVEQLNCNLLTSAVDEVSCHLGQWNSSDQENLPESDELFFCVAC